MVDIYPLDASDEESINNILYQCDSILQYYENQEPREEYYKDIENTNEKDDDDDHGLDYNKNYYNNDDFNMK